MEKSRIVEALGEEGLRLPALLNEALAANDRAKYLFTVLQVAQGHADHPGSAAPELRAEREAAGLAAAGFDEVAAAATRVGEGRYFMPGVDRLCARLHAEVDAMLAPLQAAGDGAAFDTRRKDLAAIPWCGDDDQITREQIGAHHLRRPGRHRHRAPPGDGHAQGPERPAERVSSEIIDGAHAYGISADDRRLVAAFMRGVNRTARAQVRAPRPGHHGHALGRPAGDAERHRHHRRARARGARRGQPGDAHLHRRAHAAAHVLPGALRRAAGRLGGHALAHRPHHGGRRLPPVHRHVRGRERRRARGLPRLHGLAAGVPHRLEPGAQAPAPAAAEEGRGGAAQVGGRQRPWPHGVPARRRRADDLRLARVRLAHARLVRRAPGRRARPRRGRAVHALRHARPARRGCRAGAPRGWCATRCAPSW